MKKAIILFFAVIAISHCEVYGQNTSERKYTVLKDAELGIFDLGFDIDTMKNHIYPDIVSHRTNLAPHYPDISTLERTIEARNIAFLDWIETYPEEYEAYYAYLTLFISSNL